MDKQDKDTQKTPPSLFYYNPADKRIFVPKQIGYGLTFNFGHWASWVIIVAIIVVPLVIMYFAL